MRQFIQRAIFIIALGLLSGGFSIAQNSEDKPSGKKVIDTEARSMAYYDAKRVLLYGQIEQAKEGFERIIKRWGEYPPALYDLSKIYIHHNDTTTALNLVNRAIKVDSTYPDYLKAQSQIFTMLGDTERTQASLRKLLEIDDSDGEVLRQLSIALLSSSDSSKQREGLEMSNKWESHYGYDSELTNKKNVYYFSRRDSENLSNYAQEMIAADRSSSNLLNYARILASLGQKQEADEFAREAQKLAGGDINNLLQLANFWRIDQNANDYLEAIDGLVEVTEIFPTQGRVDMLYEYINLGGDPASERAQGVFKKAYMAGTDSIFSGFYMDYLLFLQDWDGATHLLQSELDHKRINPRGGEILMQLYMQAQKLDSALMTISELEKIERPMINGDLVSGNILSMMEQYDSALEKYELALERSVDDSTRSLIHGSMGMMFSSQGKDKETIRAYEKSLKFDPNNILSMNNLAYHISESSNNTKELEKALAMINRVVEADPNNTAYIDTQAWLLYRLGRFEQALERMRLVMGLDTEPSVEVLEHMVAILSAMGEREKAEIYLERIRKLTYTAQ